MTEPTSLDASISDLLEQARPQLLEGFSKDETEQTLSTARQMVLAALEVSAPSYDVCLYAMMLTSHILSTFAEAVAAEEKK